MLQRWLVAVIGLPLLLAVLLLCPDWATMLLICAISGIAAYELLHTAGKNVTKAAYIITIICAAFQVVVDYQERYYFFMDVIVYGSEYHAPLSPLWILPCILTTLLLIEAVRTYGKPNAMPFSTVSAGVVAGAVFPMAYACIVLLRMHETYGRLYVLAPFFIAFAGDSLAMYFGKWFGKRKMAPHVSPNKTWAGFCGSILGSVLGMLLFGLLGSRWMNYPANYLYLAHTGLVGSLTGQLGDLSTSLIKREAGVKDYSHLFLTHGGVLDRFDSTLFIAPIVYYFVSAGMI